MANPSHIANAGILSTTLGDGSALVDRDKPVIGQHYDQPFRGLPAEVRVMIWRYALPDEIQLRKRDLKTEYRNNRFTRILKTDAPSDLALFYVNRLVRDEFVSIAIGKILLDMSTFRHRSLSSVWKAIPRSIRVLLRGIKGSIFEFPRAIDWLRFCDKLVSPSFSLSPHISEVHMLVDGLTWDAAAEEEFFDAFWEADWEDLIEEFHNEYPEQEKITESDFRRHEIWYDQAYEQWDDWYEIVLPFFIEWDDLEGVGTLLWLLKKRQISKYNILFHNLNYPQRCTVERLAELYQVYLISTEHEGVTITSSCQPEDNTGPDEFHYSASITFERW